MFNSREELKSVPRLGDKVFEQAAGFLRIRESGNPLDQSAVHPESYPIVNRMAKKVGCTVSDLMKNEDLRKQIKLEEFISDKVGMPTLTDIMAELSKPGRDPREKFELFEFDKNVNSMADLRPGMILDGLVTNITNFGAFVDIGVHQDGLIHVSQMADKYIKDPNTVVKLNQKVRVKVLEVDKERKRIQLSLKNV
jgi:protein Tex